MSQRSAGRTAPTSPEIEPVPALLPDASPILAGPCLVKVSVLVVRGSQSKWSKVHIKGVSSSASVADFKEQVAKELIVTAGLPRSWPDSIQLLIGGTQVHDGVLSDYGALSSTARSVWAVAFHTQHPSEVNSTPESERPARETEEAPMPPILRRESKGLRVLATEQEAKNMESGEFVEVNVSAIIFWGLSGSRRSCTMPVFRHTTVQQVEEKLVEWMGLCPTELMVQLNGTPLDHDLVLLNCGISHGSVFEVLAWYNECW